MSAIVRAQVNLPYQTNVPRDVTENVFFFAAADADTDALELANIVDDRIIGFYNTPGGDGHYVAEYLSSNIRRESGLCSIKFYNPALPLGSPPIFVRNFTLGSPAFTDANLPNECAICCSFATNALLPTPSGTVRASSLRGRVYLGPFIAAAMDQDGLNAVVLPVVQSTIAGAAERLANASTITGAWAVFSRKHQGIGQVLNGFVDNAWDTQRRRGEVATNRVTWAAP